MSKTKVRVIAFLGIAAAMLAGLAVGLYGTAAQGVWFGTAMSIFAALAAILASLGRKRVGIVIALAALASSVASGSAGAAAVGALFLLAVIVAKDVTDEHFARHG